MGIFTSTLNQMAILFSIIIIGFILMRTKTVPDSATVVLSRMENTVFMPALIFSTFSTSFTVEKINIAWKSLVVGFVVILISIAFSVVIARFCTKDEYLKNIYTYGLAFSNFAFVGTAVVSALYPDVFMEYVIFILPFWIMIYTWGMPYLLIPLDSGVSSRFKAGLKNLINPMFIAMIAGIVIGLVNPPLPDFVNSVASSLSGCMAVCAMLITGITAAQINLKSAFTNKNIYLLTFLRLIALPLIGIGVLTFIPISYSLKLCTICALAMPLGLNTVVVPAAYGKDTTEAAGMAIVSHLFGCLTIPLIFMLFDMLVK